MEKEISPALASYERRAWEVPGLNKSSTISLRTYDEMEKDSMVQTAMTIKKLAVLSSEFDIVPANESPAAEERAEFVRLAFERMEGSAFSILYSAMDAFTKGWSVQELLWVADGGKIWLNAVRPKDPSQFGLVVDEFGQVKKLSLRKPDGQEVQLPKEKFLVYSYRGGYNRLKGQSDLESAYPHWLAKKSLLAAWKVHLERFASPTVLGKFERGLPADEQGKILSALNSLADSTAIVFPSEIDVSTLGGAKENSAGFLDALDFHNREIARSILGQTLTTDEGRRVGSLALGKVHLQVLLLQVTAYRRELAETVISEQIIRPLIEMNFGKGNLPKFRFQETRLEAFASGKLD